MTMPTISWSGEPISTLSHGLGAIVAVMAGLHLLQQARWRDGRTSGISDPHGPRRDLEAIRWSLRIYGASLIFCLSASAIYHAVRLDGDRSTLLLLDRLGIFALIAGTITPLAITYAAGTWRCFGLAWAWGGALSGGLAWIALERIPAGVASGVYLAMGWGAAILLVKLRGVIPRRGRLWIVLGGLLYSFGAALDLTRQPVLISGWVGPHEVFHGFVLAGAYCHYRFMLDHVARRAGTVPLVDSGPLNPPPKHAGTSRRDPAQKLPAPHRQTMSPRQPLVPGDAPRGTRR